MSIHEIEKYYPETKQEWRMWLSKHHLKKDAIWVIMYKKKAGKPTISWSDAVDEALCFGWIDSIKKKIDEERSIQFFSKRKPKSTWSKINKDKVQLFIESGLMAEAGLKCIAVAKQNGSWELLDSVEAMIVPDDLKAALEDRANAMEYFLSLSKSVKKMMLTWLVFAKREETRRNRIIEIAEHAARGTKPKQF